MIEIDVLIYAACAILGIVFWELAKWIIGKEPAYTSLERERMEALLQKLEEEKKSLAEKIKEKVEEKKIRKELISANNSREEQLILGERERIKEALHDYTVQQLVAIAVHLEGVRELVIHKKLLDTLDLTIQEMYKTIDSVRYLIHNLTLPEIEHKSLVELVHDLEEESNKYLRLKIRVTEVNAEKSFPLSKAETQELFLIVKEALQNSIKYTISSLLHVYVDWQHGLELAIEDNGYGLRPEAKVGIGLLCKREPRILAHR